MKRRLGKQERLISRCKGYDGIIRSHFLSIRIYDVDVLGRLMFFRHCSLPVFGPSLILKYCNIQCK